MEAVSAAALMVFGGPLAAVLQAGRNQLYVVCRADSHYAESAAGSLKSKELNVWQFHGCDVLSLQLLLGDNCSLRMRRQPDI